jgi:hypothetical protein
MNRHGTTKPAILVVEHNARVTLSGRDGTVG